MADEIHTTSDGEPHTTIIERRGSGATLIISIAILLAVVVGAFVVINLTRNENMKAKAVTNAVESVGGAADSAKDAIDKAAPDDSGN